MNSHTPWFDLTIHALHVKYPNSKMQCPCSACARATRAPQKADTTPVREVAAYVAIVLGVGAFGYAIGVLVERIVT